MALIQRSCGYALRPTLDIAEIDMAVQVIKAQQPDCIVAVDNCYGEFTDTKEPCAVYSPALPGPDLPNPALLCHAQDGAALPRPALLCPTWPSPHIPLQSLLAPPLGVSLGCVARGPSECLSQLFSPSG